MFVTIGARGASSDPERAAVGYEFEESGDKRMKLCTLPRCKLRCHFDKS